MNRESIRQRIEQLGLVPVVRAASAEQALRAALALRAGNIDVIEITMTVPDALSVMRELTSRLGSEVLVGAGTVLDAHTARKCIDAGAQFIVSPGLDLEIIDTAHRADIPVLPGALTPTEIIKAWNARADLVKVFPCSAMGGAKYIKSLRAPLPAVKLLPTGGVNLTTVREFIQAGAAGLGIGAELIDAKALADGDHTLITRRAAEFLKALRQARAELSNDTELTIPLATT